MSLSVGLLPTATSIAATQVAPASVELSINSISAFCSFGRMVAVSSRPCDQTIRERKSK